MNSRTFTLLILLFGFTSCSKGVLKYAHVIPIYDDQVLVRAKPRFLKSPVSGPSTPPYGIEWDQPRVWWYEQLEDGSTKVYWISTGSKNEGVLAFIDSGFHPITIPEEAITTISEGGIKKRPTTPHEEIILVTNTAFTPNHVELVPYKKRE